MTRKRKLLGLIAFLIVLTGTLAGQEVKRGKLLRLPGATLLVGDPPRRLFLVTEDKVVTVQDDKDAPNHVGPSISADGGIVASGVPTDPPKRSPESMLQTYSVKDKKWTAHHIVIYGSVSISPDGNRLAFQAEEPTKDRWVSSFDPKTGRTWTVGWMPRIHILDIETGEVRILETPRSTGSTFSWSPDSKRLAIDGVREPTTDENTFQAVGPSIYIVDVATGIAAKVAAGSSPAWSPSGEWIAYIVDVQRAQTIWQAPRSRVKLVHPDGTGSRDLMDFGSWVVPGAPIWSPDSKSLLLNISNNPDEGTFNIYQVDIETRKRTKKVKATRDVVYGWIKEN